MFSFVRAKFYFHFAVKGLAHNCVLLVPTFKYLAYTLVLHVFNSIDQSAGLNCSKCVIRKRKSCIGAITSGVFPIQNTYLNYQPAATEVALASIRTA